MILERGVNMYHCLISVFMNDKHEIDKFQMFEFSKLAKSAYFDPK